MMILLIFSYFCKKINDMKHKDFSDIKRMLYDEFMQSNPTAEMQKSFITGMTWFEQAITEKETREDLYDFLPIRIKYDNLKEQLLIVQDLSEKYEEMKKSYEGMKATLNNMYKMPKTELMKVKREKEYQNLYDELRRLRIYKDLYYVSLVEKGRKRKKRH